MKLTIKVITKSSKARVEGQDGALKAYLRSAPEKGKANKELLKLLSRKYGVPKSRIVIRSGVTSKKKIVEVLGL